jgi:hypothetical protein
VAVRSAAWLAVLVAVLLAARRTAVGLAVVALLVELAAIGIWLPGQEFRAIRMSWAPALALLTVALLMLARRGRPATTILGRRGLAWLAAGLALIVVSAVLAPAWTVSVQLFGLLNPAQLAQLAAAALLLAGIWQLGEPVRRRTLVLLAPAVAVPAAQWLVEWAIDITLARSVTPGMIVVDLLLIAGLPALAFGLAATALHAREHRMVPRRVGRLPAE